MEHNNEIIEVTEIDTIDVDTTDVTYDESSDDNGGLGKLVIGGLVILGVGAAALIAKNKGKLEDWDTKRKIAKLEKKGYVVVTQEEIEEVEGEFEESGVIDTSEETEE